VNAMAASAGAATGTRGGAGDHNNVGGGGTTANGAFAYASSGRAAGRVSQHSQHSSQRSRHSSASGSGVSVATTTSSGGGGGGGGARQSSSLSYLGSSGRSVSDASTNTVWAPPPAGIAGTGAGGGDSISGGGGGGGGGAGGVGGGGSGGGGNEDWSCAAHGRKSRGCMTDPWVGVVASRSGAGAGGAGGSGAGGGGSGVRRGDAALRSSSRSGGAVQAELCLTHSLKAPGFKPLPLNINPGFKMCLSKFNLRHYTAVAAIVVGGGCVQAESS
jgi:hypothetical protein